MRRRYIIMKKRYVVLIVIAALLVCTGSFLLITKGRVSVKDGVPQNSRVYITDIKLENGEISYTVVNKTFLHVSLSQKPDVQKKVNGEWEYVMLYKYQNMMAYHLQAFGETTRSFEVEQNVDALVGEFRLIHGPASNHLDEATGKQSLSFNEDKTYIVGYFTVTEDMLEGLPDEQIHYTDGIRQSGQLRVENVQYADGEVTCTLINEREERTFVHHIPAMEKKVNGEWKYVPVCEIPNGDNYKTRISKKSDEAVQFSVDPNRMEAGEYRLIFTPDCFERWIYTDPETGEERLVILEGVTCLVGYLTVTEDMLK